MSFLHAAVVFSAMLALADPVEAAAGQPSTPAAIDAILARTYPSLDALYRDIHAHPELGFQETKTAALLASRLRDLGFDVTENVGRTGVVGVLRNGPGPVAMVRTELDALPMQEKTGLPYASTVQAQLDGKTTFVAHSCGHDVHMAWWIGTASALVAMKARWHGTLVFVAQPAEEIMAGAQAMVDDGLFRRFPRPDFGFAAHVTNGVIGTVVVKAGAVTSNADGLRITFKGRGAHGSMPSSAIDPIVEAAHFVTDVQTVISRQKDASAFGVVTIGSFQAGSTGNIIPDSAELRLTLRSYSADVRKLLLDGVARTASAAATMAAAPAPDIVAEGSAKAVINDPSLAGKIAAALRTLPAQNVVFLPTTDNGISASEDYSIFEQFGFRSVYMLIGGYDAATLARYGAAGTPVPGNHSPLFAPDHKAAIEVGVRTLSLSVLTMLAPAR